MQDTEFRVGTWVPATIPYTHFMLEKQLLAEDFVQKQTLSFRHHHKGNFSSLVHVFLGFH